MSFFESISDFSKGVPLVWKWVGGVCFIALFVVVFFVRSPQVWNPAAVKIFNTNVVNGNLSPGVFSAHAGDAVRINMQGHGTAATIAIPGLGLEQSVIPMEKSVLEFSYGKKGEFDIFCTSCESKEAVGKLRFE